MTKVDGNTRKFSALHAYYRPLGIFDYYCKDMAVCQAKDINDLLKVNFPEQYISSDTCKPRLHSFTLVYRSARQGSMFRFRKCCLDSLLSGPKSFSRRIGMDLIDPVNAF